LLQLLKEGEKIFPLLFYLACDKHKMSNGKNLLITFFFFFWSFFFYFFAVVHLLIFWHANFENEFIKLCQAKYKSKRPHYTQKVKNKRKKKRPKKKKKQKTERKKSKKTKKDREQRRK